MKHFKKFLEIGNNAYYTITADDDLYIATEAYLRLGKKGFFKREDKLTQGFKLLKVTPCIGILFNRLANIGKLPNQKDVSEDMIKYKIIDNIKLQQEIYKTYDKSFDEQQKSLDKWFDDASKHYKSKLKEKEINQKTYDMLMTDLSNSYMTHSEIINKNNPVKNGMITLKSPLHTGNAIIKAMVRSGLEHLYTEKVTNFVSNVYLYEQDCFGTLTIYRIITVKNVVKTIDTFIYDKKLIEAFLKTMYENESKKGK